MLTFSFIALHAHIIVAVGALFIGLQALLEKKGSARHLLFGKIFVVCAAFVVTTGFVSIFAFSQGNFFFLVSWQNLFFICTGLLVVWDRRSLSLGERARSEVGVEVGVGAGVGVEAEVSADAGIGSGSRIAGVTCGSASGGIDADAILHAENCKAVLTSQPREKLLRVAACIFLPVTISLYWLPKAIEVNFYYIIANALVLHILRDLFFHEKFSLAKLHAEKMVSIFTISFTTFLLRLSPSFFSALLLDHVWLVFVLLNYCGLAWFYRKEILHDFWLSGYYLLQIITASSMAVLSFVSNKPLMAQVYPVNGLYGIGASYFVLLVLLLLVLQIIWNLLARRKS